MIPQHITLAEVRAKALKAYKAKRLIAQSPHRVGAYRLGKYRCAIGAALTTATLRALGSRHDGAITDGFVTCEPDEYLAIRDIQTAHDYWVINNHRQAELAFVDLLKLVGA